MWLQETRLINARERLQRSSASGSLELVFPMLGKEKWIGDVTGDFNQSHTKTSSGKSIFVRALPTGSGETSTISFPAACMHTLPVPRLARSFKLGNANRARKTGKDLIASTDNLVLSPVVIAMWKPMAEAIGWGKGLSAGGHSGAVA